MTGMGFCGFCQTTVPTLEVLMHITRHGFTPDRWPNGELVSVPVDFEPADVMEDKARWFFALLERPSLWQRVKVWLRIARDQ